MVEDSQQVVLLMVIDRMDVMLLFMMNFLEWSSKNKFNTFGIYLGGGYGRRELQLELTNGQWVTYGPTSFENGGGNAGLFFSVYGVTLHAGASTIGFEYLEVEAGIGLMF